MSETDSVPVVFVHGLWMHATSWRPWLDLFTERGYAPVAPLWPGEAETVTTTRAEAAKMEGVGIKDVTDHFAAAISALPTKPIVVGHSFGGLVAQQLLARGLARAGVALAPTQFKGIYGLPLVQLESALPVLARPWLYGKTWSHSRDSYAKSFASAVSRDESDRIFDELTIPAPCRPLFQAASANLMPRSQAGLDTKAERGPLLLVAGSVDRIVPASTVQAAYNVWKKENSGVTEVHVIDKRGHSFPADSGWRSAAELTLDFLARNG